MLDVSHESSGNDESCKSPQAFGRSQILGRWMTLCVLVILADVAADPGDIDKAFSTVTIDDGKQVILGNDGTLWFVGDEDIVHLSSHGALLNRYAYSDIRNFLPHPKGGIFFRADLERNGKDGRNTKEGAVWIQPAGESVTTVDPANRSRSYGIYFQAGGRIWVFSDRRLIALGDAGEPLPGFDFPWGGHLDHVASGPSNTVVVLGREGSRKVKLVHYSAADGTLLKEFELEE